LIVGYRKRVFGRLKLYKKLRRVWGYKYKSSRLAFGFLDSFFFFLDHLCNDLSEGRTSLRSILVRSMRYYARRSKHNLRSVGVGFISKPKNEKIHNLSRNTAHLLDKQRLVLKNEVLAERKEESDRLAEKHISPDMWKAYSRIIRRTNRFSIGSLADFFESQLDGKYEIPIVHKSHNSLPQLFTYKEEVYSRSNKGIRSLFLSNFTNSFLLNTNMYSVYGSSILVFSFKHIRLHMRLDFHGTSFINSIINRDISYYF
jgi:hypothetical protein